MNLGRLALVTGASLTAAAVGFGLAYAAEKPKKKRKKTSKIGRVETGFVGSGWQWPRKDVFPDEGSFGNALERLGYDTGDWHLPSWHAQDPQTLVAVMQFQNDWNAVADKFLKDPNLRIAPTGFIGAYTVDAILWALRRQELAGVTWPLFVDQVKKGVAVA